eukprot:Nk52_evm8s696 gene=Nk52_evmTU8s696
MSSAGKNSHMGVAENSKKVAKKRKGVSTNKVLQTISAFPKFPESEIYNELVEFEKKVDAVILKKRLDMQEAMRKPGKSKRLLRVFVSNTFSNQDGSDADEPPSWTLKIEGRLIDQGNSSKSSGRKKFTSFLKSLLVEFDERRQPENNRVEFINSPEITPVDGVEIKRQGSIAVPCKIILNLEYDPPKFKLAHELGELLGMHTNTKAAVIVAVWQYIKKNKLQDAEDPKIIRCDRGLRNIVGTDKVNFSQIPYVIEEYLTPPDPVEIQYIVKVNDKQRKNAKDVCYDIEVELEDSYRSQISTFLISSDMQNDISACNEKIHRLLQEVSEVKTKREFFKFYSDNPKAFIDKFLMSQSRDLKTSRDHVGNPEQQRRASFFQQPYVQEGVYRYISDKVQERRLQLEQNLYGGRE